MLKVDQYNYIRTAYRVYGKKIRQIARETGHSRNTIKKALARQFVGYQPRARQPYPVLRNLSMKTGNPLRKSNL